MDLIKKLKKLATDLSKKADDLQFAELKWADSEADLDLRAQEMGWSEAIEMASEVGLSLDELLGYFFFMRLIDVSDLPADLKAGTVEPIFVLSDQRVYSEKAEGMLTPDGKIAYLPADVYEKIST